MATRRSTKVMAVGSVLLVLGVGNARFGADKAADYRAVAREAREAGGSRGLEAKTGTASILHRPTDAELLYQSATTKYAYYKVVRRGGRMFAILGLLLIAGAFVRRSAVPDAPRTIGRPRATIPDP